MPGLFGDYDDEDINEDPYAAPVGTWKARLSEVRDYSWDKNGKQGSGYSFKFLERLEGSTKSFQKTFQYEGLDEVTQLKIHGYLKAFLIRLEYPLSRQRGLSHENAFEDMKNYLENTDYILTTEKNGEYVNIAEYGRAIRPDTGSPVSHGTVPTPEKVIATYATVGGTVVSDPFADL